MTTTTGPGPNVREPTVRGPIATEPGSAPFRSALARESSLYVDLGMHDYVEEEWFLDGAADAIDPEGIVLEPDAPYATRVLVRRPARAEAFSGAVFVEPFHNLSEDTPAWTAAHQYLMRDGHAWAGLTVNSGTFGPAGSSRGSGIAQLRDFDRERYGALHLRTFEHGPPRVSPPGPGGFDPVLMRWRLVIATAQGHGIAAGLLRLLAANDPTSPLAALDVRRVYAMGWSQTGLFWQQYLDRGYHEVAPVVDGYFVAVGEGPAHRPADAVVVNMLSEGEVVGTLIPRFVVADNTGTPRYRGYEVAGTFHHWETKPGAPRSTTAEGHAALHNDRPWNMVVHAILDNMERWVRDGLPMPRAARIELDPDASDGVARDEVGNARGGVRSPWVDVPTARYSPRCTCSPLIGSIVPLTRDELVARYGDRAGFEAAWARSLGALVRDRWLLAVDADMLRAAPFPGSE